MLPSNCFAYCMCMMVLAPSGKDLSQFMLGSECRSSLFFGSSVYVRQCLLCNPLPSLLNFEMRASVYVLLLNALTALARSPLEPIVRPARLFAPNEALHKRAVARAGGQQADGAVQRQEGDDAYRGQPSVLEARGLVRRQESALRRFGRSPFVTGCITVACIAAFIASWRQGSPAMQAVNAHIHRAFQIRHEADRLRTGKLDKRGKDAMNKLLRTQGEELGLISSDLRNLLRLQEMGLANTPALRHLIRRLMHVVDADEQIKEYLTGLAKESIFNRVRMSEVALREGRVVGIPSPSSKETARDSQTPPIESKIAKRSPDPSPMLRNGRVALQARIAAVCVTAICVALAGWKHMMSPTGPLKMADLVRLLERHTENAVQLHHSMHPPSGRLDDDSKRSLKRRLAQHVEEGHVLWERLPGLQRYFENRAANSMEIRQFRAAVIRARIEDLELQQLDLGRMFGRQIGIPEPTGQNLAPASAHRRTKVELAKRSTDLAPRAPALQASAVVKGLCVALVCTAIYNLMKLVPFSPSQKHVARVTELLREHQQEAPWLREQFTRVHGGAHHGNRLALGALSQEFGRHEHTATRLDAELAWLRRRLRGASNEAGLLELKRAVIHTMSENNKLSREVHEVLTNEPRLAHASEELGWPGQSSVPKPEDGGQSA